MYEPCLLGLLTDQRCLAPHCEGEWPPLPALAHALQYPIPLVCGLRPLGLSTDERCPALRDSSRGLALVGPAHVPGHLNCAKYGQCPLDRPTGEKYSMLHHRVGG